MKMTMLSTFVRVLSFNQEKLLDQHCKFVEHLKVGLRIVRKECKMEEE